MVYLLLILISIDVKKSHPAPILELSGWKSVDAHPVL